MNQTFKYKFLISILSILVVSVISINTAFADPLPPPATGGSNPAPATGGSNPPANNGAGKIIKLDNPIKAKSIQDLLFSLVDFAIFLGSIVAVFMFMYIGFKFVAARGNESEIKSAKEWFTYAVIGTAILLSSKVIVEVMKNTLIDTGLVNKEVFTQIK